MENLMYHCPGSKSRSDANNRLFEQPEGREDVEASMLSDFLPTAIETSVLADPHKPGDVVAGIGAGPVDLAAGSTEGLCGSDSIVPIDHNHNRLVQTMDVGAPDAGESVDLALEDPGIRNISGTKGVANTMLIKFVAWHKLPGAMFATQTFTFKKILKAYDAFARAAETKAL